MGRRANLVQAARDCVNALPVCKRKDLNVLYDSDFGLCMVMTTRRKLTFYTVYSTALNT